MKTLTFMCGGCLLLAIMDLPIGYYTFLRILVTIGAVALVVTEYDQGITRWVILFGIVAILFNPLLPVYLLDKDKWIPVDLICGLLFIIKGFKLKGSKAT
jgi:hypothetical protein